MTQYGARKRILEKFKQVRSSLEKVAGHLCDIGIISEGRPPAVEIHTRAIFGALGIISEMVDKMEKLYRGFPEEPIPSPDGPVEETDPSAP